MSTEFTHIPAMTSAKYDQCSPVHADILHQILSHLDRNTVFTCLRVNTHFHHLATKYVYQTITIDLTKGVHPDIQKYEDNHTSPPRISPLSLSQEEALSHATSLTVKQHGGHCDPTLPILHLPRLKNLNLLIESNEDITVFCGPLSSCHLLRGLTPAKVVIHIKGHMPCILWHSDWTLPPTVHQLTLVLETSHFSPLGWLDDPLFRHLPLSLSNVNIIALTPWQKIWSAKWSQLGDSSCPCLRKLCSNLASLENWPVEHVDVWGFEAIDPRCIELGRVTNRAEVLEYLRSKVEDVRMRMRGDGIRVGAGDGNGDGSGDENGSGLRRLRFGT